MKFYCLKHSDLFGTISQLDNINELQSSPKKVIHLKIIYLKNYVYLEPKMYVAN